MGLIQTETPYFQPDPTALTPYTVGQFPSDPTFDDCGEAYCSEAWALRVLDSTNILIYGAEVSLWIELGTTGKDIGIEGNSNSTGSGIVYIDPSIWSDPDPEPFCYPPCTLVMPPRPLPSGSTTTIKFPSWSTEVYYSTVVTTVTVLNNGDTTTLSAFDIITIPTVISIPQEPPLTETIGGSTSVSSGTTLAPIITTVTPHPYPTTTNTMDPVLNTHSTSWGIGPPRPSCIIGCGTPCIGPPGSSGFNTPGGGGNPDGDDGDDECTTTTTQDCTSLCTADATPSCTQTCSNVVKCEATPTSTGATITTPIGITLTACPWSLATVDSPASLSSIAASQSSILSSIYVNDPDLNSPPDPPGFNPTSGPLGGSPTITSPPTTTPPTTTVLPTTTSPTSSKFVFQLYKQNILVAGKGGAADNTWYWDGLSFFNGPITDADVCDASAIFSKAEGASKPSGFPTSLGSFSLTSHSSCSYLGPNTATVGSIACNDGLKQACTAAPAAQQTTSVDCTPPDSSVAKDDWFLQINCEYS
ncbi:unnamed protein product [Sphagnum balticum]